MRIKGFENLKDISEFSLTMSEGQHTLCCLTLRVKVDEALSFVMNEGQPITILRDNGSTLFYGIIREVVAEQTYHNATLKIAANSFSVLADQEENIHIWQRPKRTLSDVLQSLPWSKYKCELDLGEAGGQNPSGIRIGDEDTNAVIQASETDFAFLRRLTKSLGYKLWIQDTLSGTTVLRVKKYIAQRNLSASDIVGLTCRKRQNNRYIGLKTKKGIELALGDIVTFTGVKGAIGSYLVITKTVTKEKGTFFSDYELEEDQRKCVLPSNSIRPFAIFEATVTDNADPQGLGRLRIDFSAPNVEDEDKGIDSIWIPYHTPYGGKDGKCGMVFLPDKGDNVTVVYDGTSIWISGSVRAGKLAEECANPDEKYLGNNYAQRIIWCKDALELISCDNRIHMDENKIEFTVGNNQTKIQMDKDKILFMSKGNSLELSPNGLKLKTENDLVLKGNGGGIFEVMKVLKLNGSEVDIG